VRGTVKRTRHPSFPTSWATAFWSRRRGAIERRIGGPCRDAMTVSLPRLDAGCTVMVSIPANLSWY